MPFHECLIRGDQRCSWAPRALGRRGTELLFIDGIHTVHTRPDSSQEGGKLENQ